MDAPLSLLTIYVPAFNRPAELERLLASIPAHDDVEVIVSDDSGIRRFHNVAVGYGATYEPRDYTTGRDANLIRAVAICETPWLWVMGDDDWLLPGALEVVLDEIGKDRADRIFCYSEAAADYHPLHGWHGAACEAIEATRKEPSWLIAATLCSANVFRTSTLDLREGVAHYDTYYAYAWASLNALRWSILDVPTIGVGVDQAYRIEDPARYWQAYLDAVCERAGAAPIPVNQARRWNYVSAEVRNRVLV